MHEYLHPLKQQIVMITWVGSDVAIRFQLFGKQFPSLQKKKNTAYIGGNGMASFLFWG